MRTLAAYCSGFLPASDNIPGSSYLPVLFNRILTFLSTFRSLGIAWGDGRRNFPSGKYPGIGRNKIRFAKRPFTGSVGLQPLRNGLGIYLVGFNIECRIKPGLARCRPPQLPFRYILTLAHIRAAVINSFGDDYFFRLPLACASLF